MSLPANQRRRIEGPLEDVSGGTRMIGRFAPVHNYAAVHFTNVNFIKGNCQILPGKTSSEVSKELHTRLASLQRRGRMDLDEVFTARMSTAARFGLILPAKFQAKMRAARKYTVNSFLRTLELSV
uniref:Uncharacterized protein n=1 Tax=Anguilla anguilla TaxID=7936 RepID=A0A0E9TXN3_ANGAN